MKALCSSDQLFWRRPFLLDGLWWLALGTGLLAQDMYISNILGDEDDEVIMLSAFSVAQSSKSEAGNRSAATQRQAPTAVFLRRKAEMASVEILLTHEGSNAVRRNEELMGSLDLLLEAVAQEPGMQLHTSSTSLSLANRRFLAAANSQTSRLRLYLLVDLPEGTTYRNVIERAQRLVAGFRPRGATVISIGSLGVSVRDVQGYRAELLRLILADLNSISRSLDSNFTLGVRGVGSARLRRAIG